MATDNTPVRSGGQPRKIELLPAALTGTSMPTCRGTTMCTCAWHSAYCCTMRPAITGGGEQQPNACSPVIGALETSCVCTSTPEDLAQSCWEKNGNIPVLRGSLPSPGPTPVPCLVPLDLLPILLRGEHRIGTIEQITMPHIDYATADSYAVARQQYVIQDPPPEW